MEEVYPLHLLSIPREDFSVVSVMIPVSNFSPPRLIFYAGKDKKRYFYLIRQAVIFFIFTSLHPYICFPEIKRTRRKTDSSFKHIFYTFIFVFSIAPLLGDGHRGAGGVGNGTKIKVPVF